MQLLDRIKKEKVEVEDGWLYFVDTTHDALTITQDRPRSNFSVLSTVEGGSSRDWVNYQISIGDIYGDCITTFEARMITDPSTTKKAEHHARNGLRSGYNVFLFLVKDGGVFVVAIKAKAGAKLFKVVDKLCK